MSELSGVPGGPWIPTLDDRTQSIRGKTDVILRNAVCASPGNLLCRHPLLNLDEEN